MTLGAREAEWPEIFTSERPVDNFRRDVLQGLSSNPKYLSPKYFYDPRGSRLFDLICATEEYYLTRTESRILVCHAKEIMAQIPGNLTLIELGSGSSIKTRYLLEAGSAIHDYLPIDISRQHLLQATAALADQFPSISMHPLAADYTQLDRLPALRNGTTPLLFFPGSTLGNLDHEQSLALLSRWHTLLQGRGYLLLGIDLLKDKEVLEAAYNDKEGYTADFNTNLLRRINRELHGNFDLASFKHEAFFNSDQGRIEMHLRSVCEQSVQVAGYRFHFAAGESIHTESSYKFNLGDFRRFVQTAAWTLQMTWTDAAQYFGVVLLKALPYHEPS
ncbi:MAG: L-histidine N(alpha)-methyltransferase [Pseudobdellovibrionaceae bacterium]|nr:L-histidine N(alpha)-methyltransferase [Pseudobdellovibrionaceae bacterium]